MMYSLTITDHACYFSMCRPMCILFGTDSTPFVVMRFVSLKVKSSDIKVPSLDHLVSIYCTFMKQQREDTTMFLFFLVVSLSGAWKGNTKDEYTLSCLQCALK